MMHEFSSGSVKRCASRNKSGTFGKGQEQGGEMLWQSDEELFRIVKKELFTCVVGDVMDKMRLQHQFLPPQIRPLNPDMVLIGRAMPVLSVDVFEEKITGTANQIDGEAFRVDAGGA